MSTWDSRENMESFAYGNNAHMKALQQARQKNWFKEDLFARFSIEEKSGNWDVV